MVLKTEGLACVYWIHKVEHTDEFTEGYIGVSRNPNKRWIQHKTDANCNRHTNVHLSNAIIKYEDTLIYEVIFGGTEEQCFAYELELRPAPLIGWNLMSGGPVGKITEEGRKKLSEAKKGKTLSEHKKETIRLNKYRKKHGDITRADFQDMEAINKGKLPPSKKDIEVFSVLQNKVYLNAELAAKDSYYTPLEIIQICDIKTGDWIYFKDL